MKYTRIVFLAALLTIVQLKVAEANSPPVLSGINCKTPTAQNFTAQVCAGNKLCFTICTSDLDAADSVSLVGSSSINGSSLILLNEGDKLESLQFCWTPIEAQARKSPYTFVITAKDNSSASNNTTQKTFSIVVKENPKARYDTLTTGCGNIRFTAQKTGAVNISQYIWNLSARLVPRKGGTHDTVYHHYKYPGDKAYGLTLVGSNGCNTLYTDTYKAPDYVTIKTTADTTVCAHSTIELLASVSKAWGMYSVKWSTGESFHNKGGKTVFTAGDQDTFVIARATDEHCNHSDTTFIRVNRPTKFDIGDNVQIMPDSVHVFKPKLQIDSFDTDTVLKYNWYKNDLGTSISTAPFLVANDSAIYFLEIRDSLDCISLDSVVLIVDSVNSIRNNESISSFKIFPNPAQNHVVLQFDEPTRVLKIFDVNGRLVNSRPVLNRESVDLSALEKGIYILQLKPFGKGSSDVQRQVLFKN